MSISTLDPGLAQRLRDRQPLLWSNPAYASGAPGSVGAAAALGRVAATTGLTLADLQAADLRLRRWGPALARLFPELSATGGIVESSLELLDDAPGIFGVDLRGRAAVKRDDALPVAGSIKARGGMHEVLAFAEDYAARQGLLPPGGDPVELLQPAARTVFGRCTVAVGSTGNLGMSIGLVAAALGFRAEVHMSHDAKPWKRQRLRDHGVTVVEHTGDYSAAVAAGRAAAQGRDDAYFVDDEHSRLLLLGYAVAALRLPGQLAARGITVNARYPLFVYLPCGVGGAPGGITFGLKLVYGDAVHCLFAEPCASPAMLVRLAAGAPVSVYDLGLDNRTEADGLAVAQASDLAYEAVRELVAGAYTVSDDELLRMLAHLHARAGLRLEPSAAAGFLGPRRLLESDTPLADAARLATATHLAWTTGGSLVPDAEFTGFLRRAQLARLKMASINAT